MAMRLRLQFQKINLLEYLLLFATGFFALSTFSDVVIGALGYNLIEILFLPILLFYIVKKEFVFPKFSSLGLGEWILLLLLLGSICIGIINTSNIFAIITCVRPFVYILLILKYFRLSNVQIHSGKLFVLSVGCVLGDLFYALNFSALVEAKGYHHINVVAIALITLIPIIQRKGLLALLGFLLGITASLLSGYRINTLISLVALFAGVLIILITTKSIKKRLIWILLIVLLLMGLSWCVNNFDVVSSFLTDTLKLSKATATRSLSRIASLLNGDFTLGDENRMRMLAKPFREFGSHLLPIGPIGKTDLTHFGYYTDTPFIFLYDLFGSVIAWIFVLFYAARTTVKSIRIIRNWSAASEHNKLYVALVPILLCLFTLNGTFMTFVNISILFALAISGDRLHVPTREREILD